MAVNDNLLTTTVGKPHFQCNLGMLTWSLVQLRGRYLCVLGGLEQVPCRQFWPPPPQKSCSYPYRRCSLILQHGPWPSQLPLFRLHVADRSPGCRLNMHRDADAAGLSDPQDQEMMRKAVIWQQMQEEGRKPTKPQKELMGTKP